MTSKVFPAKPCVTRHCIKLNPRTDSCFSAMLPASSLGVRKSSVGIPYVNTSAQLGFQRSPTDRSQELNLLHQNKDTFPFSVPHLNLSWLIQYRLVQCSFHIEKGIWKQARFPTPLTPYVMHGDLATEEYGDMLSIIYSRQGFQPGTTELWIQC